MIKCVSCEKSFNESEIIKRTSGDYCKECFDTFYYKCDCCGKFKFKSVATTVYTDLTHSKQVCKKCIEILNIKKCPYCERIYEENFTKKAYSKMGLYVCEACFDLHYKKCEKCGKYISNDKLFKIFKDYKKAHQLWCTNCISESNEITRCYACGSYNYTKNITKVFGKANKKEINLCKTCVSKYSTICENCNNLVFNEFIHEINGNSYCNTCMNKLFDKCDSCGYFSYENKLDIVEGHKLCANCKFKYFVNDYGYKPEPKFFKTIKDSKNAAFFGLEIEITSKKIDKGDLAHKLSQKFINEFNNLFYLKFDRSIGNGFEIVTHPMTYNFIRKELHVKELLKWLEEYVYMDGNDLCGIHIHIDKAQFKGIYSKDKNIKEKENNFLYKLLTFFYNYFDKIIEFSNRKKPKWVDEYCHKIEYDNIVRGLRNNGAIDRHSCINLYNKNTIEIRVFNGDIEYEKFMNYIRFTNALIEFFKLHSKSSFILDFTNKRKGFLWNVFMDYVKANNIKLYQSLGRLK